MRFAPLAIAWAACSLGLCGSGCDEPPAFPVPAGPPAHVALDVRLPVPVPGTWTVDGFSETLRLELAKYNIRSVGLRRAPEPRPSVIAHVELGVITYRAWQEVDVVLDHNGELTLLGKISVPDLSMITLDVAAETVAELIARWIWDARHAASRA